jgi:hypothetical protein
MLIERIKQTKKPYGILLDDIEGGFTFTSRGMPNSFSVQPTIVHRLEQIEVQRKEKSQDHKPILPTPPVSAGQ